MMKGNLPSTELQVVQLVFHFAGNEKQPDVPLYTITCVLVKWFGWMARELKENNRKVDYAEIGERGMWKYFSEWVRICEDICLCLIRVQPQRRRILIIKKIGWLVLWLSTSFPSHSCYSNRLMNKTVMVGGDAWSQQYGLPFIKAELTIATAECPTRQQQKTILSTCYDTIPQGNELATKFAGWISWIASIMEEIILLEETCTLGTDLPSLYTALLQILPPIYT